MGIAVVLVVFAGAAGSIFYAVRELATSDPEPFRLAIHDAAATGDLAAIRRVAWWCPNAVSVKYNEHSGLTPLHTAVSCHQLGSVRQLVELGCQLDAETSLGKTALYYACDQGDTEIALYLISKGAQVQNSGYFNPLHAAAYDGNAALLEALILHGADVNLTNRSGSPLHMAAAAHRAQAAAFLLKKGGRTDLKNRHGLVPIDVGALAGDTKELLICC